MRPDTCVVLPEASAEKAHGCHDGHLTEEWVLDRERRYPDRRHGDVRHGPAVRVDDGGEGHRLNEGAGGTTVGLSSASQFR